MQIWFQFLRDWKSKSNWFFKFFYWSNPTPTASHLLKCSFEGQKGQTFSMEWKLPQISPIFLFVHLPRYGPFKDPGEQKKPSAFIWWDSVPPLLSSIKAPPQFNSHPGDTLASPQAKPRWQPAVLDKIHQLSIISTQPHLIKKGILLYSYLLNIIACTKAQFRGIFLTKGIIVVWHKYIHSDSRIALKLGEIMPHLAALLTGFLCGNGWFLLLDRRAGLLSWYLY